MIKWISVCDRKPNNGEWVLTTYYMKGNDYEKGVWRTRIYEWLDCKDNRKITHWSPINSPE